MRELFDSPLDPQERARQGMRAPLRSLMAGRVPESAQGQLQGATASVQSLAQLVGPLLFTLTFAYFIGHDAPVQLPGAPFFLAAILLFVSFIVATRTLTVARES